MKGSHRAWLVCIGCTLLLFCTVGLLSNCFSIYQPYLITRLGLTNAHASAVSAVRNLFALLSTMLVGAYYRRFSMRLGMSLAAAGAVASCLLFSVSQGFGTCCAASALSGLAYGFGGMVPVSLVMNAWFRQHNALALGICTAGTGIATIVAPPVLTAMVEAFSLRSAFLLEAASIAILAGLGVLLIRGTPAEAGRTPLGGETSAEQRAERSAARPLTRGELAQMLAALFLVGAICNAGFSHLGVLYESLGFSPATVAVLISLFGVTLTLGKCLCGQATDRLGSARAGWLFFGVLSAGLALSCTAGNGSVGVAAAAFLMMGVGMSLSSVGMAAWAKDLSCAGEYPRMIQRFQTAYMVGSVGFASVPGILADVTGSYLPAFLLLTASSVAGMLLVERVYARHSGKTQRIAPLFARRSAGQPHRA